MKKRTFLNVGKALGLGFSSFLLYLLVACFVLSFSDVGSEAFSAYISDKKAENFNYSFSTVTSNDNRDSFSAFFSLADDFIGVEAKKYSDTFFFSKSTESESYLDIINDNTRTYSSALGYSTYNFSNYSMGMKTINNESVQNLGVGEVYITESLALKLLNNNTTSVLDLIGKYVFLDRKYENPNDSVRIVDIISDSSIKRFTENNLLDKSFLIYNYTLDRSYIANKIYCLFIRGDYLSSTYSINIIENTINQLNEAANEQKYISTYYDYGNSFYLGRNQVVKNETMKFFSSFSIISFFVFLALMLLSLGLLYIVFIKVRINSFNMVSLIFSLFLLFFFIVVRTFKYLLFDNVVIFLFNSYSMAGVLLVFSLLLIGVYYLTKRSHKKNVQQNLNLFLVTEIDYD